jgi:hypothetical protein
MLYALYQVFYYRYKSQVVTFGNKLNNHFIKKETQIHKNLRNK